MRKLVTGILVLLVVVFAASCAGGVSQEEYDRVESDLSAAQSQVQSLQSDLTAAQSQVQSLESDLDAAETKSAKALAYAEAFDLWMDSSRPYYGLECKYEFETEEERGEVINAMIEAAIDAGQDVVLSDAWQAYSDLMQLYTEETQGMSQEEQMAYWQEHEAEYMPLWMTIEFCLIDGILDALE